jgi:hypothetical protein
MPNRSHAALEAQSLLALVQGGETVESIRALIGNDKHRRPVLLQFDGLVAHLPRHGSRLRNRRNVDTAMLSTELKAEVVRLLRAGWSQKRISDSLPVGRFTVEQLGKQIGASNRETRPGPAPLARTETGNRLAIESGRSVQRHWTPIRDQPPHGLDISSRT